MLNSNSVASIINEPTRVSDTSSTTLDHILTNEDRSSFAPFVVKYHITDHFPVMVSTSNKVSPGHHQIKLVLKRSLATFTADIFNHDLENRLDDLFQTNSVTNENNLEELFNNFYSIFTQVIV